ncbi:hypothetical protein FE236_13425 [Mariprofundus erugo]|uniref:hypothetical protein n=1 Tax=Mariprofundus erugo TaxID=2528639 RepID=UPI0010FD656F|nr:hypothetical protein [Mariprofundus erugo]TLS72806.1 hypothetical protein FE236_13425 [Mariprofundus erugo]
MKDGDYVRGTTALPGTGGFMIRGGILDVMNLEIAHEQIFQYKNGKFVDMRGFGPNSNPIMGEGSIGRSSMGLVGRGAEDYTFNVVDTRRALLSSAGFDTYYILPANNCQDYVSYRFGDSWWR